MAKRLLTLILTFALILTMFSLSAFAAEVNDLDECELRFDGEGWKVYPVDDIDDTLTLDDLKITVVDGDGDPVDPSKYDLIIGFEDGWDEENNMMKLKEVESPFGITDPEVGFSSYGAYAVPRDNSGFTKSTRVQSFMIWHKYSFNWFGANADFGEQYEKQSTWSWHSYYEVPANRIEEPVIHGIDYSDPAPENYEITYFKRVTGIPVSDGDDYLQKVYPEDEPLEGLPDEEGSYFARINGKGDYYGTSYVDFDIVAPEPENSFEKDVELRFRDKEEWAEDYLLENKNDKLSIEDLDISVVTNSGDTIDPSKYDLHFGIEVGYDDVKHEPIIQDTDIPLGLDSYESGMKNGWLMFNVYASAKEDSGYEGSTRRYEFMLRDCHSLDRDSVNVDFGELYRTNGYWSWHPFFKFPEGKISAPKVYDAAGKLLDASQYSLTYYVRNIEELSFDDPDYDAKRFPENDAFAGLPTAPGSYFARIDGKGDYYGTSYVDFDIVETKPFAVNYEYGERYYDGETMPIYMNSDIYIYFDVEQGWDVIVAGWRNDLLKEDGFTIDDDPTFFDGEDYAFAHINTEGMKVGDTGTLYYNFYRFEDIFGENAKGWVDAEPLFGGSVKLEVIPQPLLGDTDSDGTVTILDATAIQRHIAGLPTDSFNRLKADTDRDGIVSILDATNIQRWLVNIPTGTQINEEVSYGTYYASWNVNEKLLPADSKLSGAEAENAKAEIRRAISLLIDRNEIAAVPESNRLPASSLVPKWMDDSDGSEFWSHAGSSDSYHGYYDTSAAAYASNRAEAIEILKKYYHYDKASKKFTDVPSLRYIFNDSPAHGAIGSTIKENLGEVGITLNLVAEAWSSYQETMRNGDFSLARNGWIADTESPLEFLELWTTGSENNFAGLGRGEYAAVKAYSLDLAPYGIDSIKVENGTWAETYDVLIEQIKTCEDPTTAYQLMHLAEDMLMATGCVVPLYYY